MDHSQFTISANTAGYVQ